MTSALYEVNGSLIALVLFCSILLAIEVGYRLGRKKQVAASDPIKSQFSAIQGSLLGLVSLLLGFSFSLAVNHYDHRSKAMVEEVNAIGTTYLRAHSLPPTVKKETLDLLRKYVDVRVQASQITLADKVSREPLLREASQIRTKLWSLAIQSAKDDDRVTTSGLYIQALGGLIDSYTARDEVLNRHIPEIVIISLLLTFILAGGVLGYTSGAAGHRPTTPVFLFVAIVVIIVSIIIDLDRPHRGFIQVTQKNMLELQQEVNNQH